MLPTEHSLTALTDYVRATDAHARHRLPLLEHAERVLSGDEPASDCQRRDLAGRLERWRYQQLNERGGALTADDRRLCDALDLAANELAGRAPRAPRATRDAVRDPSLDGDPLAEAVDWLDSGAGNDELAQRAAEWTDERFSDVSHAHRRLGARRRMLLYAPLYLSSHCVNHCAYCGFRYPQPIRRRHLTLDEALHEAGVLQRRGFRHILLVAGDFPRLTTPDYFVAIASALSARGFDPAVEIAPQPTEVYAQLVAAGACGVTLYQETYDTALYARYHPRGSKTSFDWRIEGLERAAEAGMGRLGLGVLLGLADPRADLIAMMRHAAYLRSRFPDRTLAFSLPRIREAPEGFEAHCAVDDELFVRLYCVLRIAFPDAELVLSTRETASLRNRLARICITQMSAGSCTVPGGYQPSETEMRFGGQFPICDRRSPAQVAAWLEEAGFRLQWHLAGA
jgi:2-iminoacetate synthase